MSGVDRRLTSRPPHLLVFDLFEKVEQGRKLDYPTLKGLKNGPLWETTFPECAQLLQVKFDCGHITFSTLMGILLNQGGIYSRKRPECCKS